MEDSVLSTAVLVYAAEYERPGKVFQRASIVMVSRKRKVSKIEVRHNGPVFKDMSVISEEGGSVEGRTFRIMRRLRESISLWQEGLSGVEILLIFCCLLWRKMKIRS